jgi:hypothetical protein
MANLSKYAGQKTDNRRRLPADEEVYRLRLSGVTAPNIAKWYGINREAVHKAIRRHTGALCPCEAARRHSPSDIELGHKARAEQCP